MNLKKITLAQAVVVFILNFICIAGYFKLVLIPHLSVAIESNRETMDTLIEELVVDYKKYQQEKSYVDITNEYVDEYGINVYIEDSTGKVLYSNDPMVWENKSIQYSSSFFQNGDETYLIKLHKNMDASSLPIINNFIICEIVVIFILVLLIYESNTRRIVVPIEKLQSAIKDYKFGIMPKNVKGSTEIDVIHNNFVELTEELEKAKAKQNQMIASISHDIKTPLTAILGYSDRLINANLTDEKKAEYIDRINNKALILKELTSEFDDYLSCNIKETLKLKDLNIGEFMEEINQSFKDDLKEKNISFSINNEAKDVTLKADSEKLRRIFGNTISNSVRYLEKKGTIKIDIKEIEDFVEFTISDNGPGVPEEDLEKIFEPLYTTDPSRKISGLGLPICKEIAETHGGYIYAKNAKNGGLSIIFTIAKS